MAGVGVSEAAGRDEEGRARCHRKRCTRYLKESTQKHVRKRYR